ncbi:hypothetical protein VNO80_15171 [Phaseolus coccineus]|uniref:Uncharacterized protein n=1 Tax=Phaseolus coccineus TaxID=3886 RepID=A0AAN9R1L3_PHACN
MAASATNGMWIIVEKDVKAQERVASPGFQKNGWENLMEKDMDAFPQFVVLIVKHVLPIMPLPFAKVHCVLTFPPTEKLERNKMRIHGSLQCWCVCLLGLVESLVAANDSGSAATGDGWTAIKTASRAAEETGWKRVL